MASALHRPLSFRIEEAALRKPCAVISFCLKPRRRRAPLIVFSLMQRAEEWVGGKRNWPRPVTPWRSRRIATACGARGTRCGRRIFILPAGIEQSAPSRSNFSPLGGAESAGANESEGEQLEPSRG